MAKFVKKKILGLIPARLKSKRLPRKVLLPIKNFPLIVHVYKRAQLSKMLSDVYICCDDKKIIDVTRKFNAKSIITSKKHKNGTERINEAYHKIKKKYSLIVDIQGDEPLINPLHIDKVIDFHLKNIKFDIVLPVLNVKAKNINKNIVKVVTDQNNNVLYLSRSNIPLGFKKENKYVKKHLSIVSFKPLALKKFAKAKKNNLEKKEDIELLRALEIGLKIKTLNLKGNSFSVDVLKDYKNAKKKMNTDKIIKRYI